MAGKLTLKIAEAGAVPGGLALMLCDDHGNPLPNQRSVNLYQRGPGDVSIGGRLDSVIAVFQRQDTWGGRDPRHLRRQRAGSAAVDEAGGAGGKGARLDAGG